MFMYWQPLGVDRRLQERLQIARREAGVVLDFGRERELPQRQRAREAVLFGDRPFEHERLELCPRRVNGRRPTGRSAPNDDHLFRHDAPVSLRYNAARMRDRLIHTDVVLAGIIGLRGRASNGSSCCVAATQRYRKFGVVERSRSRERRT